MKLFMTCSTFVMSLLIAVAAAQTVVVDSARGTDFSRFHTFTWATAPYPIEDPDASLRIARAVCEELQSKGMQLVGRQDKFDVFITYNAKINPEPKDMSRKLITLTVRIFDSRNNTVIWRAAGYVALVNDKEQNRRNVRALLAKTFEQYPPPE